jgi:hypothetical protein
MPGFDPDAHRAEQRRGEPREPETPAAMMRRAAKLIRERAALVPPPPWYPLVHDVITDDDLNVIASSGLAVRTQYVASWHPGVAVAVADLLDKLAWMGELDPDLLGRVGCDEAIAIARAYLGESDG